MAGMYPGFQPADFGMPDNPSRRWVVENSNLARRMMFKTPDVIEVPIPADRQKGLFTHVSYIVGCGHIDACNCADDDSTDWEFFKFVDAPIQPGSP